MIPRSVGHTLLQYHIYYKAYFLLVLFFLNSAFDDSLTFNAAIRNKNTDKLRSLIPHEL